MSGAAPGRVLRLSVAAWGLGELALGRSRSGLAWLAAEVGLLAVTVWLTVLLIATTWYLLPYLAGAAFLVLWALQAVLAYRHALGRLGAEAPTPRRSPAGAIAWLAVPLLVWGTGFWLVAGSAGSPEAILDRFVTAWPQPDDTRADELTGLAVDPGQLLSASAAALDQLRQLCAAGQLTEDCAGAPEALLRDVRMRLDAPVAGRARAVAELVRYERRETRFLGLFAASELEPVPVRTLLELQLATEPGPLGSERWTIVNASPL